MESMRRLGWLVSVFAVCAFAHAQRPPIAWIGGGEVSTYIGFYFQDDRYFVTSEGFYIHFWRLSDNKLVRTLTGRQLFGRSLYSASLAPMPNRQQLVVAYPDTDPDTGYRGIRIRILQPDANLDNWTTTAQGGSFVEDGTEEDEPGNAAALAISPDGQYIAVGGGDAAGFTRHGLVLYRVNGTQIERTQYLVRNPSWAPIFAAAFSPDGEWLFAGSAGGWVFVYKRQANGTYAYHQRFIIGGNGFYINCFAFANRPDGLYVAVGVMPNGIIEMRRFNPVFNEWRLYMQWQTPDQSAPTSSVNALQFSPDGSRLAAAYGSSAFGVVFYDPYLRIYQINYSSDPDYRGATPIFQEVFPYDVVTVAAYNANASELISGTRNGDLRRWSLETREYTALPHHRGFLTALAWSPDGTKIATAAQSNYSVPTQTFVWDFASQSVQARINHLDSWIGALAFSPNGNYVATAGRALPDRTIDLWDATTGDFVVTIGTLSYNGSGLAFSPDGQYLYAAARNGELKAFQRGADWQTWTEIAQTNAPDNALTPVQIALSPDGSRLAVGSQERVQIYLTPYLTLERQITVATEPERIMSVAWSPDGRYIAAGTRNVQPAPVYLINTADWSVRRLPTADNGYEVYAISFTPDGCYVLGAGSQNSDGSGANLMLWHTGSGTLATQYDDETLFLIQGAAFSPDGRYIAYGRDDGSLVVANNPFYRRAGDVNRDGCVNDTDLLLVLFNFGGNDPNADLNCDGVVNDSDLLIVLFNFGSGC